MKIFNWIVIFHVSFPFKMKSRGLDVWEILVVLNGVFPFKVSTAINDFWNFTVYFPPHLGLDGRKIVFWWIFVGQLVVADLVK